MRAENLFKGLDLVRRSGALQTYELKIKHIVTVPEKADEKSVYVAVRSPMGDGRRGAAAAYSRGCRIFVAPCPLDLPHDAAEYYTALPELTAGLLAAKCHAEAVKNLTVVGVTGTHAKTSVVETAAALLLRAGKSVAILTTDGMMCGERFVPFAGRAPDAEDIWQFLCLARQARAEFAVIEFSSYMLAQRLHASIPFAAVLLTDYVPHHIGTVHADELAYRAAKQSLLRAGAPLVLVPCECASLETSGRLIRYGNDGEIALHDVHPVGRDGIGAILETPFEKVGIFYPVVGDFAHKNAVAAAALAVALGLSAAEIAQGMPYAEPVGRLERLACENERRIYLDAAYEGEDLATALRALRTVTDGRLSVLLGAVGGRAMERRVPLGTAAFANADFIWLTADDADAESPQKIAEAIVGEYYNSAAYRICPSRAEAIEAAVADLARGDTLLILGKPREDTQLVCGKKQFFSDRAQVQAALARHQA